MTSRGLHSIPRSVAWLGALLALGCSCADGPLTPQDAGAQPDAAPRVDAGGLHDAAVPIDTGAPFDASPIDGGAASDAGPGPSDDAGATDDAGSEPSDDASASDDAGPEPLDAAPDAFVADAGPPPPASMLARIEGTDCLLHPLAIAELDDGDVVVVGRGRDLVTGDDDGFVLRLSSALDVRWVRLLGGDAGDVLHTVVALPGGDVIAGGATTRVAAGPAPYLARVSRDGSVAWSRTVPLDAEPLTSALAGVSALARSGDGTIYAVGTVARPSLGLETYVARLDADGAVLAEAVVGVSASSGADRGRAVAVLADGRPVIALAYTPASLTRAVLVALAADLSSTSWVREHREDAGSIRTIRLRPSGAGVVYLSTADPIDAGRVRWIDAAGSISRVVSTGRARALIADGAGTLLGGYETMDRAMLAAGSADLGTVRYVQQVRPAGASSCEIADLAGAAATDHRVALLTCAPVASPSTRPFWVGRVAIDGLDVTCPATAGTGFVGAEVPATVFGSLAARRTDPATGGTAAADTARAAAASSTRACSSAP